MLGDERYGEALESGLVDSVGNKDSSSQLEDWQRSMGAPLFKSIHKLAKDRVGGIVVAWNTNSMEVLDSFIGTFSVSVLCKNKKAGSCWIFSGVYGPYDQSAVIGFWEELKLVRSRWHFMWCLGADFNIV